MGCYFAANSQTHVLGIANENDRLLRAYVTEMNLHIGAESDFKREMEIDFGAGAGIRVFPIFTEKRHTAQGLGYDGIQYRSELPMYRCWDFGWKKPATLISQIGEDMKWYILAELQGKYIPFYIFRSLIFHVCGVLERIYEEKVGIF